ncbi:MAG: TonB-dependent receptor [Alphaproteobacteria bacterium]|nr:TonB-dependent receptor [Alphaproteobacteria bacterium]
MTAFRRSALRLIASRRSALLLALLVWAGPAHADPRDDARRHFRAGLEAANAGSYREAIDEFLAAYAAIPHAATAFNIGRAYEDLREDDKALYWYQRFQEMEPGRAAEADDAIARVQARLQPAPVAAPVPAQDDPLDRLAALDAERAALAASLRAQGVEVPEIAPAEPEPEVEPAAAPDVPQQPSPAVADAPEEPITPDAPREGFLTDAYERVIVTASRYSQDPLDAPSSITVITSDDIRMSGAVHVADILRRAVGVDVTSMTAGVPYVGIRAFNGEMTNKVLWLLDGRPTSLEFLATPMPVTLPVALDEIERIEIIRGPGSAIYGANAVTGVVNIITKRPGEGDKAVLSASAGANRFVAGSAVASGTVGKVGYRFSAGYQQEGRFEQELTGIDEEDGTAAGFSLDQGLGEQRVRAAGRVDTTFADKGWVSLSGGWSRGTTEYASKAALGYFGLEGDVGHARFDLAYGPFHLRTYWQREEGYTAPWLYSRGGSRTPGAYVRDDVADVEAEGTFEARTGKVGHRLQVGAGYTYKQYRAGVRTEGFLVPRVEHHGKVFGQYELSVDWFRAMASLRYDRHPLIPNATTISPRGALVFRVTPTTAIRASAGSAFRAMNGLESYVNLELGTTADGYFVNFYGAATNPNDTGVPGDDPDDLGAEQVINAELGVRDESSSFHALDAAVYWNRVTNLIDIGSVTPQLGGFQPKANGYPFGYASWINDRDTVYDNFGAELDLTLFPVDGLDVFANVAISQVLAATPTGTTEDGSTSLVHANLGVLYRSPVRLDLSLSGHLTSAQTWQIPTFGGEGEVIRERAEIPARVLMVARIAGRPVLKPELELALTLWNPLGFLPSPGTSGASVTAYREHPSGQVVGPRLLGTAALRF